MAKATEDGSGTWVRKAYGLNAHPVTIANANCL
jgi:hypothetical protein